MYRIASKIQSTNNVMLGISSLYIDIKQRAVIFKPGICKLETILYKGSNIGYVDYKLGTRCMYTTGSPEVVFKNKH